MLIEVEQAASDLMLLSTDISMFEAVRVLAADVLRVCEVLKQRASQLHKTDFSEQIIGEEALLELDEIVDRDVISAVEQCFSNAWPDADNQIGELLRQLLQKLEKHYAVLNQRIQQLGGLLGDDR